MAKATQKTGPSKFEQLKNLNQTEVEEKINEPSKKIDNSEKKLTETKAIEKKIFQSNETKENISATVNKSTAEVMQRFCKVSGNKLSPIIEELLAKYIIDEKIIKRTKKLLQEQLNNM